MTFGVVVNGKDEIGQKVQLRVYRYNLFGSSNRGGGGCNEKKGYNKVAGADSSYRGKEVTDNRYVLHLTPTLQLTITFLSFEIRLID